MEMTSEERAAATGAALLDRYEPGWIERIDLDRLDISRAFYRPSDPDSCGCVLAQLGLVAEPDWDGEGELSRIGYYSVGKAKLLAAIEVEPQLADGFHIDDADGEAWVIEAGFMYSVYTHSDELTDAWKVEIGKRRPTVTDADVTASIIGDRDHVAVFRPGMESVNDGVGDDDLTCDNPNHGRLIQAGIACTCATR